MSEKVCIVGDGGWGTAIGLLLHANGYDVTIWGPFEDYLSEIRASHMNQKFLPGVEIPREIVWTHDPRTAAEGAAMAAAQRSVVPVVNAGDVARLLHRVGELLDISRRRALKRARSLAMCLR